MNRRNFFAELRRRNVYKVAVAYAVVGWLVMQVASTVLPALHLPHSITTAVVVLMLLGVPIALRHLLTVPYGPPPITSALLRLDPTWDPLRSDPRFQELCQDQKP